MSIETRKEAAADFLRHAASGKVREAYRKYIDPKFRHHNAYYPGDAESLMCGMEESAEKNPNKVLEIKNVIAEGDLVAVHSWIRQRPEDRGAAVVHIFRFEGERIVELWDLGQAVPENSPNENGMF